MATQERNGAKGMRTLLLHALEGAKVEGSGSRAQAEGFANAAILVRIDSFGMMMAGRLQRKGQSI